MIIEIHEKGYKCTFGEAFRTNEQADIYVAQGKGIKKSLHCSRLAVDLNLFNDKNEYLTDSKPYDQFGKYWELLHPDNRYGGNFSKLVDANHFEMKKSSFGSNVFNGSLK